ncbi:G-protein coupled receptor GRL101 [Biomphalaria glabrata]|nr:G-protein coupled receptor GRL101 [Biomphalaria glabrata]
MDVFLYSEIENWRKSFNSEKTCFALKYNALQNKKKMITNVDCTSKKSKYSFCEQKPFQSFKTIKSNSQMRTYAVPNDNFINNNSKITSISNSKTLSGIDFPKFFCKENSDPQSYNYVCDGVLDCVNKMDEKRCNYDIQKLEECIKNERFVCREPNVHGLTCIARRQVCDMIKDCPDGSDESNCDDCIFTQCSPNVCIPDHWTLNCSIINQERMNEPDDKLSLNNTIITESKLHNLNELKTMCNLTYNESNEMYNKLKYNQDWAPKCIDIKDRHGAHIGCSDFSHLRNCSMFQCPEGFSKCWESYCIPDSFIHDGVKDCPHGEDEEEHIVTTGLHFACYLSSKKLHPIYICDGKPQCPRGDDELNCQVLHCPSGFICLDGTVSVNDTNTLLNMSSFSPDTTFLDISGIDVSPTENFLNIQHLKKMLVFIVSRCRIDDNTQIIADNNVIYHLDVSYNNLSKFSYSDLISNFLNIFFLNVSHNTELHFIPRFYFRRFEKLTYLDLSFSKISEINLKYNQEMKYLYFLETNLENIDLSGNARYRIIDLRNTRVSDTTKENFFNNISVRDKVLADYKLCCSYFRGEKLLAHQCEAEKETLSTCEDLIGHSLKRVFLWIVAICAVLGNMISLGYRILFERATLYLPYVLFVTCLGVSDLLMGIYLVIIASVDVVYRNIYIIYESSWKQSTLCQIAGTLATLSSETSTFFILLITLERFLTIRFPFGEHKISKLGKYILISFAWCLGFLLSVIPTMYEENSLYSTNGMCLGFPLRKSNGIAWIYSVTIFLFFNSFLFVVIAIGQFLIFMTISQHSSKFKTECQTSARRADNITVALKLSVVVLSNFICWFPVCVMGIRTVVSDYEVTSETYSWIIALVLPINSALNPILYTLPRVYKLWTEFRRRKSSVA